MRKLKKICLVGTFRPSLERNLNLIKGLESEGIALSEINSRSFDSRTALDKRFDRRFLGKHIKFWCSLIPRIFFENILLSLKILRNINKLRSSDLVVVPSYGNYCVFTAKLWSSIFSKPLVLDAHGSLYYQRIIGVKDYPEKSIYARIIFLIDWFGARLSDKYMTLSDNYSNKLSRDFGISKSKFMTVYTGTSREISNNLSSDEVDVVSFGSFKAFHGNKNLILAADCLAKKNRRDIKFVFIGNGSEKEECVNLASSLGLHNVKFTGYLSKEKFDSYIHSAKILCGPLGESSLNNLDLSNKICEAAAWKKPLITKKSDSVSELFEDRKSVIMCNSENPEDLAEAILLLIHNERIRTKLGNEAYKVYRKYLTPNAIAKQFMTEVNKIFDGGTK